MPKTLIFLLCIFVLYTWNITNSFEWNSDWTRDIYAIIRLSQGRLTLIGPPLTGAVFAGPYYYYIWVPALIVSKWNELSILFLNAALFTAGIALIVKVWGYKAGLLIGLSPWWISAARHPGNAFSYLPLLALLVITGITKNSWGKGLGFTWGFLSGVVINFHPSTCIVLLIVWTISNNKEYKKFLWALVGVLVSFIPSLLFEYKHSWVMTQAIISGRFIKLITEKVGQMTEVHYLLPFTILCLIIAFKILTTYNKKWLINIFIIVWVILLVRNDTFGSLSRHPVYSEVVDKTLQQSKKLKTNKFNLIEINDEKHAVVSGNGYRYELYKRGYRPLEIDSYDKSDSLLIFSYKRNLDINDLKIWELNQFGKDFIIEQRIPLNNDMEVIHLLKV